MSTKKSVLFVCLGNICRSPVAEAVLAHHVEKRGLSSQWHIDSAAIGSWHVGGKIYKDAQRILKTHHITSDHIVRQVKKEDFRKFDVIFGMDHDNISDLTRLKPKDATAKIQLLGEYDPEKQLIIEDPYYGTYEDFGTVYQQCDRCCKAFLDASS